MSDPRMSDALDCARRAAEQDCTDPTVWADLAAQYDLQDRPAMAARCRARAAHYAVAVETLDEVPA